MKNIRLIPTLLIDNRKLIKTRKFKNPKYLGDPINVIKIFNDKEVDEIMILDIYASRRKRNIDYDFISSLSEECFMPLSYGGGIKKIDDASKLFDSGIEKIVLQSAFLKNPKLINDIANKFGSQSIIISLDLVKLPIGYYVFSQNKFISLLKLKKLVDLLDKIEKSGAGEIFIQIVNLDGTRNGADKDALNGWVDKTNLPLIVAGGIRDLSDVKTYLGAGADAVGGGAFFVYHGPHDAVVISYPKNI